MEGCGPQYLLLPETVTSRVESFVSESCPNEPIWAKINLQLYTDHSELSPNHDVSALDNRLMRQFCLSNVQDQAITAVLAELMGVVEST